ncbi:MAG: patatin-like phospholipase family protein [Gammaproteobacteria bacterium]|nr:patatin-like phospholipase family protein [Gammaproteobacteria bacterium]
MSIAWCRLVPAVVVLLSLVAEATVAQEAAATDRAESAAARPRVGLVLGGGGARGAAHIGVLKELERLQIPVDAIAGTSMGAIVGGLYSIGMSADELEELVGSLDWAVALSDRPNREYLDFRRKQDDSEVPIDFELGLRGTELVLPQGAIQGQKLDMLLRELTLGVSHIESFDDLPIPFRAVASDIERGEIWVMDKGDLAQSIRASMSVPGVFSPVRIDDRLLVDGGLVGNLAVHVMQEMGVDIIIAVDVEFPLYLIDELDSVLTISEQMLTILIRKETLRQIERLGDEDILIRPELGTFASTNFDGIVEAIEPGVIAARNQEDKLRALAVDDVAWRAYLAQRSRPVAPASTLAFVRVVHDDRLLSQVLMSRLTIAAGDPVDHAVLAQNADRLYGLGLYEKVSYELVEEDGGVGVVYRTRSKSWGPNFLQFGVSLEDDFEGSTAFNLEARMTRAGINRLGAEWRTDLRLGTDPKLFSEFYQPLSFDSRLFIAPHVNIEQTNLNAFANDATIARLRLSGAEAGIDLGRELGRIGEFRIGVFRGLGEARVRVGDPALPNVDFDTGGAFARLRFDTLDNTRFPRSGLRSDIKWTLSRPGLGADLDFDTIEGEASQTWSRGKNSLQLGLSYATTLESESGVQDFFPMGGFLRLSGLERGEIAGPHAGLAKLVYYRRIGDTTGIMDTPVYLGVSAEVGNVWRTRSDMSFDSLILNGSLFAGFDTFIGPVYIAAGFAEHGQTNFYLFIGAPPR